jgi:hypothetical protein
VFRDGSFFGQADEGHPHVVWKGSTVPSPSRLGFWRQTIISHRSSVICAASPNMFRAPRAIFSRPENAQRIEHTALDMTFSG